MNVRTVWILAGLVAAASAAIQVPFLVQGASEHPWNAASFVFCALCAIGYFIAAAGSRE